MPPFLIQGLGNLLTSQSAEDFYYKKRRVSYGPKSWFSTTHLVDRFDNSDYSILYSSHALILWESFLDLDSLYRQGIGSGRGHYMSPLGEQPIFGLLSTALTVVVTHVIYYFFFTMIGMDPVGFMLEDTDCHFIGQYITILMFQPAHFRRLRSPLKNILLLIGNAVIGQVRCFLYKIICTWVTGGGTQWSASPCF